MRKGTPITCNDIENDPLFKPWRKEALKRGFYSSIGLPIMARDTVYGIFNLYSGEPFFFDENEIKSLEDVVSDISYAIQNIETNEKLKKAEDELQLWRKELLDYFEHDISADFFVDPKGNLISCNNTFYKMFEIESDQAKPLNVSDFYKNNDERNKLISLIKENKKLENYEMEMISKSGKELHLIGNILGNFDDSGNLISIKKYLVDITQRKMAEELLLKLSKAVDQSPVSIIITNKDAKIEYVNPKFTETTGYTMKEATGKNPKIISIHSKTSNEYKELWDTILSGSTWAGEFLNQKKNGELFWEHAIISPIMNKNGEISHFVAITEDITEKKAKDHELIEALEKAQESDRLKSAFLANMSHEIRTPMNGILGFAELLKEPLLDGDVQQEYLGLIEKSAKRMLEIITNIVDLSKVEAGMTKLTESEVNINQEIDFAYHSLIQQAKHKGLEFKYSKSLPDAQAFILTDKEKLYSIITNLLKNAIKFTHSGSISLEYEIINDEVRFCVKDTGIGISYDLKNIIFERFRQGNETLNRIHEGAGLGLAISKAFVEMLNGKIWFESETDLNDPNHGTRFYFTVPYRPVKQNESIAEDETNTWEKHPKLNILITEDDEISKLLLNRVLKPVARKIYNASSGEEAVRICSQIPGIDLVLMDIKLPGMNGYDATRKIRKFNKNVLIIAQTAFAMEGDRDKALDAGCDEYIAKPIQISKLNKLLSKFQLQ
ncbi:MAG: PAS domain S-box protein [Bacteroidales bacterium]|nr:PAS domain S-box protein [Bacteroidales bacterium]